LQKSLSQPELRSAPSLSGKVVLPQCRPWTKPLSAQPRRAKGSKKRTGTVGTTGTIGIVGIVGTAVGDQHGLSLAARLCSRAFFQAGTHAQPQNRRHKREAANRTKTFHVKQFCPIEA
jgi:hypothetical protein